MSNYETIKSQLKGLTPLELIKLSSDILDELQEQKIVRTKNLPIADYTEQLVAKTLNLELAGNSERGYDAFSPDGTRYQIKARRLTRNKSHQLSAIRGLDDNNFDYLIGVIYHSDYTIKAVFQITHAIIKDYATYIPRTNSYKLHLQGALLTHPQVNNITNLFF